MKKNQILKRKRENDKTQQKCLKQPTINDFFKPIQQNTLPQTLKKFELSKSVCQNLENKETKIDNGEISQNNFEISSNKFLAKPINKENLSPLDSIHKATIKINSDNNFISPKIENEQAIDYSSSDSKFADNVLIEYLKVQETEKQKVLDCQQNLFYIKQIATFDKNFDNISQEIFMKFDNFFKIPSKILVLSHNLYCKGENFYVFLSGKWQNVLLEENDFIEVFGNFDKDFCLIISNETPENYIIYEPSITLYPTLILDSHKCLRRGVLGLFYVGKESQPTMPLIIGCLAHKMFEHSFKSYNEKIIIDKAFLMNLYRNLLLEFIEDIYVLGKEEADIDKEFLPLINSIADFFQFYINEKREWIFNEKTGHKIKILRVLDAEAMIIWSEMGLKGQLDAIFYCEITDQNNKKQYCFIPFELKTGKEYYMHFYQGFLYSLLLKHKYGTSLCLIGFFFYLQTNKIIIKMGNNNDVVDLILRRNALAFSIKRYESNISYDNLFLPNMLEKNLFECSRCPFNDICSNLYLSYENENTEEVETKENFEIFETMKQQITKEEKNYVLKWMNLLKMEENFEKRKNYSMKTTTKKFLENQINTNFYDDELVFQLESIERLKDILYTLNFKSKILDDKIIISFCKSSNNNDEILNSYEKLSAIDHANIRQPETKISIKCFIEYKKIYQKEKEFFLKFEARVLVQEIINNIQKFNSFIDLDNTSFKFFIERVDKTYYPNLRSNVFDMVLNSEKKPIKDLIIYDQPNTFENSKMFEYCSFENLIHEYKGLNLNEDQIETIKKCLLADHFNLILGMPGTGKTHTLAILLKILFDFGYKVLISSYTHSALDHLMEKFIDLFPEVCGFVCRYGKFNQQLDEKIQPFIFNRESFKSCKDLKCYFENKKIFFVTTLSTKHAILKNINFDYCIIEEASLLIEPLILGPLLMAKKFILIGDYYQLQPLVKNREAFDNGLKTSLFERLCKNDLTKVSRLRYQYRMNNDIMYLSNTLIYKNCLVAANKCVAESKLDLNFSKIFDMPSWVMEILDPERRVLFLNIDELAMTEEQENPKNQLLNSSKSFLNILQKNEKNISKIEKELIVFLCKCLKSSGLSSKQLVVLAVYNLFKNKLDKRLKPLNIEVMTVDKSQGLDNECILISCSKKGGKEHLMNNWRRINVAFTRAKKKLIIVGSINQLSQMEKLREFVKIIKQKNWCFDLQKAQFNQITINKSPNKL